MSDFYASPALRKFGNPGLLTVPLSGIEAQIYDRLWRGVVEGKLKPGAKLREDVICEAFGVSRTVVRKVLVIMEQEGIADLPPNRGAYVATPSPESARAVQEALHVLVSYVVRGLSAPDGRPDDRARSLIELHIGAQRDAELADDFVTSRLLAGEFYVLLAAVYGNEVLTQQVANLFTRYAMGLSLFQLPPRHLERAPLQSQLLALILAGKSNEAVTLVLDAFAALERTLRFEAQDEDVDLRALLAPQKGEVAAKPLRTRRRGEPGLKKSA
jgi:DNA-binding GntR family transcriptional regulator